MNQPGLTEFLEYVAQGKHLTTSQAEAAFDRFMDGTASEIQMAGLLVGMRAKGLASSEIAGGVRALRSAMNSVSASAPDTLVDTAGTGGGAVTTFNISTTAAFVAAGGGCLSLNMVTARLHPGVGVPTFLRHSG